MALAACGGLAGEPQVVATLPPQPTPPPETGYPLQPPDLALGAQLFAEHCTACHGVGGKGDGSLVGSEQLPTAPPDLTDPANVSGQRPTDWYGIITNGRIENLMPPWRERLTEDERWAVATYTYTLAYSPDQVAAGRDLWAANCAECHGETGRGDGPKAAEINRPVTDLTNQSEIVAVSDDAFFTTVSEGVGDNMPAFQDTLSEEQRRAVVMYARTLSLANAGAVGQPPPPAATEAVSEATEESVTGAVTGTVTNGTVGGEVPADLTLTLHDFDAQFNDSPVDTTVNPDGSFAFDEVPISNQHSYIVATRYRDRVFTSTLLSGDPSAPSLELPLTIYELTEDPSVISITRMAIQIDAIGDGLQVAQVIFFNNSSDRAFTSSQALDDSRYPSLVIPLPPGSVVMGFSGNEQRYTVDQNTPAVIDTIPVLPGEEHIVQFVYFVPYSGGAIIEHPLEYAVNGPVRLLLSPPTVTATSEQLQPLGPQQIGDKTYDSYGADLALAPGDVVRYELRGQGEQVTSGVAVSQPTSLLPVILLFLGGGALLVAALLYVRGRGAPAVSKERLIDTLVREIADLDARHEAGQINHDLYRRQRSQLKDRLAKLMEEE